MDLPREIGIFIKRQKIVDEFFGWTHNNVAKPFNEESPKSLLKRRCDVTYHPFK